MVLSHKYFVCPAELLWRVLVPEVWRLQASSFNPQTPHNLPIGDSHMTRLRPTDLFLTYYELRN